MVVSVAQRYCSIGADGGRIADGTATYEDVEVFLCLPPSAVGVTNAIVRTGFQLMAERPNPSLRVLEKVSLTGTMAVYASQAEASLRIPQQWREFRSAHPSLSSSARLYGASPCTGDHKIHYLTGVERDGAESLIQGENLTLEAGEYAVVQVDDPDSLRDTWMYLLESWLPASGRKEKQTPEFERYTGISEAGTPIGPVEVWIPLEQRTES